MAEPIPRDDALGAIVDITYALIQHMRQLQAAQDGFSFDDLTEFLQVQHGYIAVDARERVWQVISRLARLVTFDGRLYHMVEASPPSIDETLAEWKVMFARLKPKVQRVKPEIISRQGDTVNAQFEQYRPKRSASRWLIGAPECIIACYDNGGRTADRYTVLFGGRLWDARYARSNWEAGLDPRLVQSLSMSENPTHPQGVSMWSQCMRSPRLGKKVCWHELPQHIRDHAIMRAG